MLHSLLLREVWGLGVRPSFMMATAVQAFWADPDAAGRNVELPLCAKPSTA